MSARVHGADQAIELARGRQLVYRGIDVVEVGSQLATLPELCLGVDQVVAAKRLSLLVAQCAWLQDVVADPAHDGLLSWRSPRRGRGCAAHVRLVPDLRLGAFVGRVKTVPLYDFSGREGFVRRPCMASFGCCVPSELGPAASGTYAGAGART